jgi:diaminohydroxyphosphoribosylaminopyrimidine deaminase / 5-amino-6-(5-phosphoribosylamino)uracil reductase
VDSDALFLDATIALAERGLYTTTPNPRVGCLLVRDGRVIGRGWHQRAGGPHAEVAAIAAAQEPIAGATCYVSLEPCAHHGRTPPCADALIAAGLARVVVAAVDPNPRVAGQGIARMRAAGINVDVLERPAARELNIGFFKRMTMQRPWVRLKVAASLDGRTAMASGESQWITGAAARADVQYWRARSCAVVTGIGTVLADDARLNVRADEYAVDGVIRQPLRVVVDSQLRTPTSARMLQVPGSTLFAAAAPTPAMVQRMRDAGADVFASGGQRVDVDALLGELARRGANEVLVEAGPTLTGEMLRLGLWDEAVVYLAPKLLGRTARPFAELSIGRLADALTSDVVALDKIGDDVRIRILRVAR